MLVEAANLPSLSSNDVIVTNIRHYEALKHALESIHRVQEGLSCELSGDFISQDLRECIYYLSDIIGEVTTDQVLGNIFSHFCIGK
jgi:tRNA modification GTPase